MLPITRTADGATGPALYFIGGEGNSIVTQLKQPGGKAAKDEINVRLTVTLSVLRDNSGKAQLKELTATMFYGVNIQYVCVSVGVGACTT